MNKSNTKWGRGLPTAVVLAAAFIALNFGFMSQAIAEAIGEKTLKATAETTAQSDQPTVAFDIPSQPLESGLVAFSQQADINIIGVTAILREHRVAVL